MADIVLNLISAANAQGGQPAVAISLDLTIGNTPNANGSYTVTAASGTYTTTDASGAAQSLAMSLAPGSIDGADNELFLNGGPLFDLGGITFATNGDPDGATYTGENTTGYPQDVNLFYTGSTTTYGGETFVSDLYGIDTKPVSYLIQPVVNDIVANGSDASESSVQVENALMGGTIEALGSTTPGASIDATVTVDQTTLTGVLLEAQGAGLVDVQSSATVVDSTAEIANGGAIQFETAFSGAVEFSGSGNTLTLSQPGDIGPITGFTTTDTIAFANFALVSDNVTVSGGDTLVSVTGTDNGQVVTENLTFVGDFSASAFQFNDPANGIAMTEDDLSCFCRGTRIRTPSGETPVETLARGDLVMTVAGEARPILLDRPSHGFGALRRSDPLLARSRQGRRAGGSCSLARPVAVARSRPARRWRADPRRRPGQRDVDRARGPCAGDICLLSPRT